MEKVFNHFNEKAIIELEKLNDKGTLVKYSITKKQ